MRTDYTPKILGIMQSAADKTIQIRFNYAENKVMVAGKSIDVPVVFKLSEFAEMTVHEILNKAGVPIDENAGK